MSKRMKLIPLVLVLLFAGCIVTGNILVVIELEDKHLTTNERFDKWHVSKEEHQDWKDHEDDIRHVVDVGFSVTIDNSSSNVDATGEFYISKDGELTADELDPDSAGVYRVLSGIVVPAGETKHITWQGSYKFLVIENFATMKEYVMGGEFWLYVKGVGTPLDIWLEKPAVILTMNAKP